MTIEKQTNLTAGDLDARLSLLMKATQSGDQRAYAELLRLATPIIARIATSQRNPDVETDDIVQDVLVSLHTIRHTYDPKRPFTPWLASITRHRMVDAYRKRARISRNEAAMPDFPETFSDSESNWEVDKKGDPDLLRLAIQDLPDQQRRAVELLKLRELSLKEASATSGMSVAALKVAVHRGLKTLRLRFAGKDNELK